MKRMNYLKRIRGVRLLLNALLYLMILPISMVLWRKDIYIISERCDEARDNGYHLFKYYRQNHPDKLVYYVIKRKSADYDRVAPFGNIIEYKSIKHYLLFVAAKYKISTHIFNCAPSSYFYKGLKKLHLLPGKVVFLQHGITQNDIPILYRDKLPVELFVCGAKPEYDFVSERFHFDKEVVYTGFARFDRLYLAREEVKNQILVMPTWRRYNTGMDSKQFIESDYYKYWDGLLRNKKLHDFLESNNIYLIFYPHYQFQPYLNLFEADSRRIIFANSKEYDVQELLIASRMLITDYSSVFFDFAYMKKFVIYYQFDKETFFAKHYYKGYFDYEKMGFGPVCDNIESTVVNIKDLYHQDFSETIYSERAERFFPLRDENNCKRIYDTIEKLY